MLHLLEQEGFSVACPTPEETKHGSVETLQDARTRAEPFKRHREEIDGVIVTLPNFGDEKEECRQCYPYVRTGCASAGSRISGRARQNADGQLQRQFLRDDFGLQ
jgi:hypothetical protein